MGRRIMSGVASLATAFLLLLPAHTYAAPSLHLGGGDLGDFQKTEDWELGPGTRPGPVLSSAKKVYLRAFLKEMRKISEMITSPNWRLNKKTQDEDEPRLNRRGFEANGLDLGSAQQQHRTRTYYLPLNWLSDPRKP